MVRFFPITKVFTNFFLMDFPDTIDFQYSYGDGFTTDEEARRAIHELSLDMNQFSFMQFCGLWYAIFVQESAARRLMISRERLWLQEGDTSPIKSAVITQYDSARIRALIPFRPEKPDGGRKPRFPAICFDLEYINNDSLKCVGNLDAAAYNGDAFLLYHNSMVFLGCCLFETNIPVFQLDSINNYSCSTIGDIEKLWSQGVKAANPFHNTVVYADKKPYCLNDWIAELQARGILIDGYDPKDTANKLCSAWRRK